MRAKIENEIKLGISAEDSFLLHHTGVGHPESPQRVTAVNEYLSTIGDAIYRVESRTAAIDELSLIHSRPYIDMIMNLECSEPVMLDQDTVFSAHTREAALKAAGGTLASVDAIMAGKITRAFCAVRPPGHHAEYDRAMGFCVFNNIAIGAAYALANNYAERIAIVDWDLHHGNGTQNTFYNSDKVLYISLHQFPYYPGTGSKDERGEGPGEGLTINIPMPAGSTDGDYRGAFVGNILPALRGFKPELLFISAGFDAHRDDPLGDINLSTEFYGEMTSMMKNIAQEFCGRRIISALEGGYNPAALRDSVRAHIEEMMTE